MTRGCDLPLDSYRLAYYAVQVPCYVCDGGNTYDAELCRHCLAPMALAHQSSPQKVRPSMIAVLGTSGSGKTVYLGMLMDMLSRRTEPLQILARGAFSVSLQQLTTGALSHNEFPTKTPNEPDRWNWVHCQVRSRSRKNPFELIIPDMAGEAVLEEINHPKTFPVIRSFLTKCSGVMLLIDAIRLQAGEHDQDHFSMKVLTFLSELFSKTENKQQGQRPIALVLTKADQCEQAFDDPDGFAKTHAAGMWRHCQERIPTYRTFATGVAGSCAYRAELGNSRRRVPLRVEPRGMIEPFEWLVDTIPAGKKS
jgi:GTPase SAR1 family protein